MTLKIWGDKDGTFYNFGSQEYIIRVFPVSTNQFAKGKPSAREAVLPGRQNPKPPLL